MGLAVSVNFRPRSRSSYGRGGQTVDLSRFLVSIKIYFPLRYDQQLPSETIFLDQPTPTKKLCPDEDN